MKKTFFYHALSALFIGGMAFSAVSCADDDLGENANNGNDGAVVRFNVSDVQEDALTRGGAMTRGAITPELTNKELEDQKLLAEGDGNLDACLIETVMEGVNPVKVEPSTRANIVTSSTLGNFSSTGIRGTVVNLIGTNWFDNKSTTPQGVISPSIPWSWGQRFARFYAVYPESTDSRNGINVLSQPTATKPLSIEFTVNTDVTQQVDLMTACSGKVEYKIHNQAPRTDLQFHHALTAIRFAVGQDLSFNKTIKEISIDNALLKSKYNLSNELNGSGAGWDNNGYNKRGKVTLTGLSYNTIEKPNSIIRNQSKYQNPDVTDIRQLNDGYTFYMIPQTLDGNSVKAEIVFSDGTKIHVPLKGTWREGTTHIYKLSEKNSNWEYELTTNDFNLASFTDVNATGSTIQSFRRVGAHGEPVAVPWEVVGYSEDGKSWSSNKPAWLQSLSAESGKGSTDHAEAITATLKPAQIIDLVAERNKELRTAAPLGSEATPYNLSNKTGVAAVENTANCYVISAPGYYMIPLVYGNAIKGGATNSSAYKMTVQGNGNTLTELRDHNGFAITNPWIEKTNGGANKGVNKAKVVWQDETNLVTLPGTPIYSVNGNAYVKFEVKQENIKSGNAVISVQKGNTTLWSWHLWFAPKSALDKISVTNKAGNIYDFTNETLGWKPTKWLGSPYQTPRTVKIKIKQTIGKKKESIITITQLPGSSSREGYTTLYQWGRKDAFPGTSAPTYGSDNIKWNAGDQIFLQNIIQNPQNFYTAGIDRFGNIMSGVGLTKYYTYLNFWSMNNTKTNKMDETSGLPVVKTIYDPCPVGFSVPANDAFTGFTENGKNQGKMKVDGTNDEQVFKKNFGHIFWTNDQKKETIFFPAAGYRGTVNGVLYYVNKYGDYWSADPHDTSNGCVMGIQYDAVYPLYRNIRTFGFSVRPVAEK